MNLKFVGKGSAFLPSLKTTGAYYMKNRQLFIIDCGENVFGELYKRDVLSECESIIVLITHLHADHVGSLGSLISYCYCVLRKPIHVIHSISTIVEYLDLIGIKREFYQYGSTLPVQFNGMQAEAVEVKHVDNMKSFGYILKFDHETIYYSGDAAEIPAAVLSSFWQGDINFICQDAMAIEEGSEHPAHCTLSQLKNLIAYDYRERVYCMHLDLADETVFTSEGFKVVPVE